MNTALRDDNCSCDDSFFFVTVQKAYRPSDG